LRGGPLRKSGGKPPHSKVFCAAETNLPGDSDGEGHYAASLLGSSLRGAGQLSFSTNTRACSAAKISNNQPIEPTSPT
jgi:hypothetical protein